ncbi:hypothetical protein [Azonexus sp.]|jgi:hypothetical protein|uniref:hypothetical protein n=1 Tax=Azonexus sp. TaxID=1872668 RepID=UPI00281CE160|nr:hypothetical protein [Azonexus sp.]MDR1995129.1 hypothetical protein [Azonexus sp.]
MKIFINRLRLRYGLTWESAFPGCKEFLQALRHAVSILAPVIALVLLYCFVGRIDYEVARAAEIEARAALLARCQQEVP